ncbi:Ig-like domain-containing protein [Aestuariibacter sp. AA17]|uniref:Ig-like domain-containing protein n=1 Tax=Fluctibacter corallii TaxID=2984329 RepID=A0ABT3A7U9_9ALTE|nr:Ig-like domain-containing protein [Aestuariibacter sp. AA17]MCV2884766.1 Ig-like domain-containing protein [Aestuariibacter sp. AA17]
MLRLPLFFLFLCLSTLSTAFANGWYGALHVYINMEEDNAPQMRLSNTVSVSQAGNVIYTWEGSFAAYNVELFSGGVWQRVASSISQQSVVLPVNVEGRYKVRINGCIREQCSEFIVSEEFNVDFSVFAVADDIGVAGEIKTHSLFILDNDFDHAEETFQIHGITSLPQSGNVALSANAKSVLYNANATLCESQDEIVDQFGYTVINAKGDISEPATVTVHVACSSTIIAQNDRVGFYVGEPITFSVVNNDIDSRGRRLFVKQISSQPILEGLSLKDNVFTYTSTKCNDETVSYNVENDIGDTAQASVELYCKNPYARDDFATVYVGDSVDINLVANDIDPGGESLVFYGLKSIPYHGHFSPLSDGSGIRYAAYSAACGEAGFIEETFQYRALNAKNKYTNRANVTVRVLCDSWPIAENDSVAYLVNQALKVPVLANDYDPKDSVIRIGNITQPEHGTVRKIRASQVKPEYLLYEPAADRCVPDTFQYTVFNGLNRESELATVTLSCKNDGSPIAVSDYYELTQGESFVEKLIENDADPNGLQLRVEGLSSLAWGRWELGGQHRGFLSYAHDTPQCDENGVFYDRFSYRATNSVGQNSNVALITVKVRCSAYPVANDDSPEFLKGKPVTFRPLDNDKDPSNKHVTFNEIVRDVNFGTLINHGDGQFTYTPNATDVCKDDAFTYTIVSQAGKVSRQATVKLNCVFDRPIANDDYAEVNENGTVYIPILENDEEPFGAPLYVYGTTDLPFFGWHEVIDNGQRFKYTHQSHHGTCDESRTLLEVLTYEARSENGASNPAKITVRILCTAFKTTAEEALVGQPFELRWSLGALERCSSELIPGEFSGSGSRTVAIYTPVTAVPFICQSETTNIVRREKLILSVKKLPAVKLHYQQ